MYKLIVEKIYNYRAVPKNKKIIDFYFNIFILLMSELISAD